MAEEKVNTKKQSEKNTGSTGQTGEGLKNNKTFAALAYIPIIGWILPLFIKKEDGLCQFHAKQGLVLSIMAILLGIIVAIAVTEVFEVILVILYFLVFIGFFLYGFLKAYSGLKAEIPIIDSISEKLFKKFKI